MLANSIRHHLNIFQDLDIVSPVFRMFIQQIYEKNIEDKSIDLKTRNASIYLPKKLAIPQSDELGIQVNSFELNHSIEYFVFF